jgi:pyruvate formate lyase activating enzyme
LSAVASPPPLKGFIETSFVDWRGAVAAVLFLPGCNLACPYCHNYALVSDPDSYLTLEMEDVLARLTEFAGWIDGVVVSGGEPTLHPGLSELLALIKGAGFRTKLDTNGLKPGVVKELCARGLVDVVAMDLKAPLVPLAYARAAGRAVDMAALAETISFLIQGGAAHEFRSTIWPAWHGERELRLMAEALTGAQAWTLQAMNPQTAWNPQALGAGQPYGQEDIARLQMELADPVLAPGQGNR